MSVEVRNERVLAYLRTRIDKATPRNSDIAEQAGLPMSVAEGALYQLRSLGSITIRGGGNSRVIEIVGEGKTIARASAAARDTLIPYEAPLPARVERTVCPRCQAVNCTRHSAAFLTTGNVPAWRVAA